MTYNDLTKEEIHILINKGTESPFSGIYYKHNEEGAYLCKRCNTPLFLSESKFDSGCGWPSFENNIPDAVKRIPDADGKRTEIICNNCGGHLGHVFVGENFTKTNTRHCVNSLSLNFKPAHQSTETAIFAAGCFWGVEYYLKKYRGVISVTSGYIGGHIDYPSYKDVCSGTTGHAEAVKIAYNPKLVNYEDLVKYFFEIHDFEQVNGQGPDIGTQYRSAIFYLTETQKETALKIIKILKDKGYKVATSLEQSAHFWEAESYHQDYYNVKGSLPYCHTHKKIF